MNTPHTAAMLKRGQRRSEASSALSGSSPPPSSALSGNLARARKYRENPPRAAALSRDARFAPPSPPLLPLTLEVFFFVLFYSFLFQLKKS